MGCDKIASKIQEVIGNPWNFFSGYWWWCCTLEQLLHAFVSEQMAQRPIEKLNFCIQIDRFYKIKIELKVYSSNESQNTITVLVIFCQKVLM